MTIATRETMLLEKLDTIDWADWAPVWTMTPRQNPQTPPQTPHDYQERHAPSRPSGLQGGSRRRILEARLWEGLPPAHQSAAAQIHAACHALTGGLGYRTSAPHLERISGGTAPNLSERDAESAHFYLSWARQCTAEGFSHAAGLDIIIFGKSCAAIDRARRRRKGWARQNLADCLDIYCRMKGWPGGQGRF